MQCVPKRSFAAAHLEKPKTHDPTCVRSENVLLDNGGNDPLAYQEVRGILRPGIGRKPARRFTRVLSSRVKKPPRAPARRDGAPARLSEVRPMN